MGWISAIYDLAVARSGKPIHKVGQGHHNSQVKKIPDEVVLEIRRAYRVASRKDKGKLVRHYCEAYGVHPTTISAIACYRSRSRWDNPLDPDLID